MEKVNTNKYTLLLLNVLCYIPLLTNIDKGSKCACTVSASLFQRQTQRYGGQIRKVKNAAACADPAAFFSLSKSQILCVLLKYTTQLKIDLAKPCTFQFSNSTALKKFRGLFSRLAPRP